MVCFHIYDFSIQVLNFIEKVHDVNDWLSSLNAPNSKGTVMMPHITSHLAISDSSNIISKTDRAL